jgi:hypothetical protein
VDSLSARRLGAAFETLLLVPLLEPFAGTDAPLGSFGSSCLAQSIADRDQSGFGSLLARMLERTHG